MMKNSQNKKVLAIDIGGSKLQVGLVDESGAVLDTALRTLRSSQNYTKELILDNITQAVQDLEQRQGSLRPNAIGVSLPGPCNPDRGLMLRNFTTGIGPWSFAEDLEKIFHVPVYGDNDVNACAVAEKTFGNCKNTSHFMWMTVSTGCGGAFYLNDALYRGANNLAGEIGHIPVEFEHPALCSCGIEGDMEIEGSGFAIGRKYLAETDQPPDVTFGSKEVSEKARAGDKIASLIFYRSGFYIGRLCAMAQNMLNLQKAVIGGGVAVYDFDLLQDGIDDALEQWVFPLSKEGFTVEKTALGYNAALVGAGAIALRH
ncbi:MAG: ROK family protein [Clostridiales bacterium]|nr:ROK family protein [Clostridiales bacterium]